MIPAKLLSGLTSFFFMNCCNSMLFLVAAGEIPVVIKDWLILVKSDTYWC